MEISFLILRGAMDLETKLFLEGFEQRINVRFDKLEKCLDGHDLRLDLLERNQHDMQEHIAYLIDRFGRFADDMSKMVRSHDVRITNLESRVQFV